MTKTQGEFIILLLIMLALYASGLGQWFDHAVSPYLCPNLPQWPGCS